MSAGEWQRIVKADRLPVGPFELAADETERAALARRFDLPAVHELTAVVQFATGNGWVEARGHVHARFDQYCGIAGNPFANCLEEPIALRFVRGVAPGSEDEAIECASDDPDEIEYDGSTFDLGEAVAQSFGLALDPYATGPDAQKVRREAGVVDEDAPGGPFAALAALKPKS